MELIKYILADYSSIRNSDIQIGSGVSTRELVEKSLEKPGSCGQGHLAYDCYGAPCFVGQGMADNGMSDKAVDDYRVSITSTEDGGRRLCLTAVHDQSIAGIGIDYARTAGFSWMFEDGAYCGGRMFTEAEQEWLKQSCETGEIADQSGKQLFLAKLFSGKEAALKSPSNIIREKIPEKEADSWRMEFREFEIRQDADGKRRAVPFGRTAETVEFLGIKEIDVITRAWKDGAVSVAVSSQVRLLSHM